MCGGEPFLFDCLIDVVAYAGKKNIRCSITTNGMKVFKLSDQELGVLSDNKTEINISVDSFEESIQTFTRGTPAALQNALKSIIRLNERRIPVTILAAISKYNYHDLFNFISIAYKKGVKQVLFQPIIYYSNYPDRPTIENKSQLNVGIDKLNILMDELRKILKFESKNNISTNVYRILPWIEHYLKTAESQNGEWFFEKVLNKFYCREIYAIIDISYNGRIQPCGLAPAEISIFKNRQIGLIELWSQATSEIKNDLENNRYRQYCNGCCHHFSRNMLASIMKYPFENRATFVTMFPLLVSRLWSRIKK